MSVLEEGGEAFLGPFGFNSPDIANDTPFRRKAFFFELVELEPFLCSSFFDATFGYVVLRLI
jgi:hypothetical protein